MTEQQDNYTSKNDYHDERDIQKIISYLESTSLKEGWDAHISDGAGDDGIRIPAKYVRGFINMLRSRPAPSPDAPKFNSTDLLLLAHDEWKRREERKHNHPEGSWCQGFINGFLTNKKWARDLLDKMYADAQQHPNGKQEEP